MTEAGDVTGERRLCVMTEIKQHATTNIRGGWKRQDGKLKGYDEGRRRETDARPGQEGIYKHAVPLGRRPAKKKGPTAG